LDVMGVHQDVTRPGTQIQEALTGPQSCPLYEASAPAPVTIKAQYMIDQVIPMCHSREIGQYVVFTGHAAIVAPGTYPVKKLTRDRFGHGGFAIKQAS
jgi:hypothetical protein